MNTYSGKFIPVGRRYKFEPSKNGKYAELKAKQQAQLEKLEAAKKIRSSNPDWDKDRDLRILLGGVKHVK